MTLIKIIHEDSNYDKVKDMIFIRLVYLGVLKDNIKLQENEYSEYRLINSLNDSKRELIPPF